MTMSASKARILGLAAISLLCLIADARSQTATGDDQPLLNSERISQRFGS